MPAKPADESAVRLRFDNCKKESLIVYTDEFRTYDPLKEGQNDERNALIHGEGQYMEAMPT